jgi:VWFA-related protein
MRRFSGGLKLSVALFALFALNAQQSSVFTSATRLVVVNAVIHGKDGKAVSGLTKDRFQLFDNGQPQQIVVFSEESSLRKPTSTVEAKTEEQMPDVFSNRVAPAVKAQPNVTVILLDALNTDIQDQSFARDQVIRFLRQIQPGDHIGIYALGSGLRVIHDFSTDSSDLLAALEKYGVKALARYTRRIDARHSRHENSHKLVQRRRSRFESHPKPKLKRRRSFKSEGHLQLAGQHGGTGLFIAASD